MVPQGRYQIRAVQGPMSIVSTATTKVSRRKPAVVSLTIEKVWDARAAGYVSADQHVHLNADGAYRMTLADTLPLLAGEDLDQLSPMSWNRYDRNLDSGIIGKRAQSEAGHVAFQSQEVRSCFHGHVGLIGTPSTYYPWFFGPRTPFCLKLATAAEAAQDLLNAIDYSEEEAKAAYGDRPTPRLMNRFEAARKKLRKFLQP